MSLSDIIEQRQWAQLSIWTPCPLVCTGLILVMTSVYTLFQYFGTANFMYVTCIISLCFMASLAFQTNSEFYVQELQVLETKPNKTSMELVKHSSCNEDSK